MKNLMILMVLVSTMTFTACAQKNGVPAEVKTAFNKKFPDAQKASWDKENAKEWEVEFKMNGKKYSANYDTKGNWKETEYKIKKSEIPSAIKTTLDKDFNGYKIEVAEISETADGKVYEMMMEKGNTDMEAAFTADGKLVKKEVKKENDEENDEDND